MKLVVDYRIERKQISRFVNGKMSSTEDRAFRVSMETDSFLKDSVEGFQSDLGALQDLPQAASNWQFWVSISSIIGLAAVLLFFLPAKVNSPSDLNSSVSSIHFKPLHTTTDVLSERAEENVYSTTDHSTLVEIEVDQASAKSHIGERSGSTPLTKLETKGIDLGESELFPRLASPEKVIYIGDLKVLWSPLFNQKELKLSSSDMLFGTPAILERNRLNVYQSKPLSTSQLDFRSQLSRGLAFYESGEYVKALNAFSALSKITPSDVNILFYSGLCHYHLRTYDRAKTNFETVIEMKTVALTQEARWYLALTLDDMQQIEAATGLYMQIAEIHGHYSAEAKRKLQMVR